jgi:hypothetical protein
MAENTAIRGVMWKLHVSSKGQPDPSLLIAGAVDDELTRLLRELQGIADDFLQYFSEVVVPNIDLSPVRIGVIDQIALLEGQNTTNVTDFLLLLGGLVAGGEKVIEQARVRFDVRAEPQGSWGEVGLWDVSSPAAVSG